MTTQILIYLTWFAGVILACILFANFIAPAKLNYRENVTKMEPFLREVFYVHCAYIMFVVGGMAFLCFAFARELVLGETALANACVWFLALFWGSRIFVQLFYYNRAVKRTYPLYNVLFTLAFGYLAIHFTALALIF